ncbi:hypothetical protein V5O48_001183 [Marasmius crinis-equi]|uniref:Uncharacterized protein n=1 Tax=Marasmius crinis-equi TaxID=585013 RepID=A0ABR3FZ11_9AGAR
MGFKVISRRDITPHSTSTLLQADCRIFEDGGYTATSAFPTPREASRLEPTFVQSSVEGLAIPNATREETLQCLPFSPMPRTSLFLVNPNASASHSWTATAKHSVPLAKEVTVQPTSTTPFANGSHPLPPFARSNSVPIAENDAGNAQGLSPVDRADEEAQLPISPLHPPNDATPVHGGFFDPVSVIPYEPFGSKNGTLKPSLPQQKRRPPHIAVESEPETSHDEWDSRPFSFIGPLPSPAWSVFSQGPDAIDERNRAPTSSPSFQIEWAAGSVLSPFTDAFPAHLFGPPSPRTPTNPAVVEVESAGEGEISKEVERSTANSSPPILEGEDKSGVEVPVTFPELQKTNKQTDIATPQREDEQDFLARYPDVADIDHKFLTNPLPPSTVPIPVLSSSTQNRGRESQNNETVGTLRRLLGTAENNAKVVPSNAQGAAIGVQGIIGAAEGRVGHEGESVIQTSRTTTPYLRHPQVRPSTSHLVGETRVSKPTSVLQEALPPMQLRPRGITQPQPRSQSMYHVQQPPPPPRLVVPVHGHSPSLQMSPATSSSPSTSPYPLTPRDVDPFHSPIHLYRPSPIPTPASSTLPPLRDPEYGAMSVKHQVPSYDAPEWRHPAASWNPHAELRSLTSSPTVLNPNGPIPYQVHNQHYPPPRPRPRQMYEGPDPTFASRSTWVGIPSSPMLDADLNRYSHYQSPAPFARRERADSLPTERPPPNDPYHRSQLPPAPLPDIRLAREFIPRRPQTPEGPVRPYHAPRQLVMPGSLQTPGPLPSLRARSFSADPRVMSSLIPDYLPPPPPIPRSINGHGKGASFGSSVERRHMNIHDGPGEREPTEDKKRSKSFLGKSLKKKAKSTKGK